MYKSSSKAILAAFAVMAFSATAFAADAPAKSEVKDLARVEVTGSRLVDSIEELPASAYVVTREDIANSGARNLEEALKRVPGVYFSKYTQGMTHTKKVSIRGIETEILLLVDGVPFQTSGSAGNRDLRKIPMENIERIEVVKGSSSAVYGSSAAGGVINVITRKGAGESSASTKIETGSNGWFKGAARGTVVTESGLSATLGYTKTRESGAIKIDEYKGKADYTDDYDGNDYNVRFEKGAWSLTGDWGDSEADYIYKGKPDGNENKYARVALNYNDGTNIGRVYYNRNYRDFDKTKDKNSFDEEAIGVTFNRRQKLWGQNFVYGIDYRNETFVEEDWKKGPKIKKQDKSRDGIAPYLETTFALGAINMDLGLRYEHWSMDGADDVDEIIPRVSFNYETESGKLVYLTAGRFFALPYFNQLVGDHGLKANEGLDPEQGWTYDLGIKDMKAKNPWSLGVFYIDMKDKIESNYGDKYGSPYRYINLSKYRAYGFEGQYTWNINKVWSVTPGVSYTYAENKIKQDSDWARSLNPRWDVSTFVNYKKGEWAGELGVHYYADRELKDKKNSPEDMFLTDIAISWTPELMPGNIFRLACTNLFDNEYIIGDGSNTDYFNPERRVVLTWEHQF